MIESNEILSVKNLKKYFYVPRLTKAVDGISFSLKKGEIVGLLGPNGAGKTTTIQMLLGTLTPISGEIYYFSKKFDGDEPEIKKKINFASAYSHLPFRMTVWENLDVYGRVYQVPERSKKIEKLLKAFHVWDLRNKTIIQLSAGQKTRILLTKAFLNWPEIILLDEPTVSLDPENASQVRKFLHFQQEQYQTTILLTSHNMKEVEEMCDRIIFLNKGKILALDTPEGLIKRLKKIKLKMIIKNERKKVEDYLKKHDYSFNWQEDKIAIKVEEEQIPKILYRLSEQGVFYSQLEILRPNLEDFFLQIAKKKRRKESNI